MDFQTTTGQPLVAVSVGDCRVNITVRLCSGLLTADAASQIERALQIVGNMDVGLIVLRLAGRGVCDDAWGTVGSPFEWERAGTHIERSLSNANASFLLPTSIVECLARTRVPVVAMVKGRLLNECFSLLALCQARIADVNHDLIAGSSWLQSARVPREDIHAVVMFNQLRSHRLLSATEAADTGWMHDVWHSDEELAAWEQHFTDFATLGSTFANSLLPADDSRNRMTATSSASPWRAASMAAPEGRGGRRGGVALSLLIRNLPKDSTSESLAATVAQMGFDVEFAYVPARGSRFTAAKVTLKYGFVGFVHPADIRNCLDAVHHLDNGMKAEASMTYGKKHVVQALSRAKSKLMDPSKLPVLIARPSEPSRPFASQ